MSVSSGTNSPTMGYTHTITNVISNQYQYTVSFTAPLTVNSVIIHYMYINNNLFTTSGQSLTFFTVEIINPTYYQDVTLNPFLP